MVKHYTSRSLARRISRIFILEERTFAVNAENQAAVMYTTSSERWADDNRGVVVTRKLSLMKVCDRMLVVHDGVIAEDGNFDSPMRKKGIFSQLASGGGRATD
ncbi:hypothetical protein SISSUDRAFT_681108 [Sistotremastrum suecicum HHB10207 ss-3]|uniref:Uncharacterized protein n=1 Tax=Sistotremastrum suecicum HHB10207 ss-3 TaxID=1314776 RepID=A0A166I0F2_9AGAM|nr:hypothetical protein SISSUDRAFT_681108 [Sistotremastrum suecicum HHB10207 ss-3]